MSKVIRINDETIENLKAIKEIELKKTNWSYPIKDIDIIQTAIAEKLEKLKIDNVIKKE